MKIDLTSVPVDPRGEPFRLNATTDKPASLGDVLYNAVTICPKSGAGGSPSERRELGRLADLLVAEGEVEISEAQKAMIMEACDAVYNGLMLVKLDKIFAQAVLGHPELVEASG